MWRLKKWIIGRLYRANETVKAFSFRSVLRYYFFQNILGINKKVPWPVHFTSVVIGPEKIKVGKGCNLGTSCGCYINGGGGIETGDNVLVGPGVKILSVNHDVYNFSTYIVKTGIKIGSNCWLGANAVVLAGVELGDHTIVAAGAVVTKSFVGGNCILAGVPAKKIKDIGEYGSSPR